MILLDERFVEKCSSRFVERFGGLGIPARLEYGDANFWAGQSPYTICVEVKRVLDLLISIERTGRLDEQRRKASHVHYRYYLVLHGFKYVRPDADGWVAEARRGSSLASVLIPDNAQGGGHPLSYRRMDNYLNTLATLDGVVIKETGSEEELVEVIKNLYFWWQKPEEEHTSTLRNAVPRPQYLGGNGVGLVRRWASELSGVGVRRSKAVEAVFEDAYEMVMASEREWRKVEGIGEGLAKRIVREIRGKQEKGKQEPWMGSRPDQDDSVTRG